MGPSHRFCEHGDISFIAFFKTVLGKENLGKFQKIV